MAPMMHGALDGALAGPSLISTVAAASHAVAADWSERDDAVRLLSGRRGPAHSQPTRRSAAVANRG